MAKIKRTKVEMKAQRESLKRFQRYLPMLILKKQQLQVEIQSISLQIESVQERQHQGRENIKHWTALLGEPIDIERLVVPQEIITGVGNIAGVSIPLLKNVRFREVEIDLFTTPPWVDDAMEVGRLLIRLRIEREILEEQRRRVQEELRTTTQRVNLFEKVKIPECKENIRIIKIFLGDEQTAGVARGKIAKRRSNVEEEAA